MSIFLPILAVTVIGIICGVGLSVASHFMAVKEDERFPKVRECLPGANCGACGFSGCDGYAHALLEGNAKPNMCVPGGAEAAQKLSEVLGIDAGNVEKKAALVRCSGTCTITADKYEYKGIATCEAARMLFGGNGKCTFGCIGLGDCTRVCPNDAIEIVNGIARVQRDKCSGCGLCAKTCPQKVITVTPVKKHAMVVCSNLDRGALTHQACSIGCIGCKKCEKTCANGAIHVEGTLAKVDESLCTGCGACVEACTTGCIQMIG